MYSDEFADLAYTHDLGTEITDDAEASQMQPQGAMEQACLLAVQRQMALVRRGIEVYAIHPDGHMTLICRSHNVQMIWHRALRVLETELKKESKPPKQTAWLWSIFHNCVVPPFMPFLQFRWMDRIHDWSAEKAFGRVE